jgi:hypothetical protein
MDRHRAPSLTHPVSNAEALGHQPSRRRKQMCVVIRRHADVGRRPNDVHGRSVEPDFRRYRMRDRAVSDRRYRVPHNGTYL